MPGELAFQKREKSLAERIIIIAGLGIMMAIFIHYFLKNEESVEQAGLTRMAKSFAGKVNVVQSQWQMDNRPNIVRLQVNDSEGNRVIEPIVVNQWGWISSKGALDCGFIWQQATETPLTFMNEPIGVVVVNLHDADKQACRYQISSGAFFEYIPQSGKVVINAKDFN